MDHEQRRQQRLQRRRQRYREQRDRETQEEREESLRRQSENSQRRHVACTADEDGATSYDTSISFSCAILSLCTWSFASILFTAHPTQNGQYP